MSYQVLARKWRPKSFNELIGQEHVVTVLVNALTQQRLHHAYLFTGTRGVGKTTIARIFAKSLNCQQGVTATPCGTCDACIDIDQGKFIDLLEIDAASRTKVDDTREILDNVQYAPTRGRYKVYLIDEVHMLSRSSFNALLKTLEEPPEHVKFILATTDPQKLPVTVLSRCLQFHLKALSVKQISEKISEILGKEQVGFDDEAIALLAKAARGSMRDCLSLTDQSIAQGNGNISRAGVQQMLGGVDRDWVFKILIALLKQDAKALMELSLAIASYAPSYSRLSAELIQLLHQVAMAQVVDNHFSLPLEHQQMLSRFCQLMSPEDVQLYYQIVLSARKDLPYADDEQAAFDMMLLRLLAFKPIANSRNLPEISEQVENTTAEQELNELALTTLSPLAPAMANENKTDDLDKAASDITEMAQNSEPANTLAQAAVGAEQHDEQPVQSQAKTTQVEISPAENTQHEAEAQDTTAPELSQQNSLSSPLNSSAVDSSVENRALVEEMHAIEQQASTLSEQSPDVSLMQAPQSTAQRSFDENDGSNAANNAERGKPETAAKEAQFTSPVAAALATRNMLRSRKKSLEDGVKKPNDAKVRPTIDAIDSSQQAESPQSEKAINADLSAIPVQAYSDTVIDPATIKLANQVDKWAHMIDSMSLAARLRQLAIHATIDERSTDDVLILQLDQSIKHLNSDAAHKQLESRISEYLQRQVTVEVNIVEKTIADPYQIQADINVKRYEYAKQVLAEDNIVIALQQQFQAELDQETIVAR